MKLHTWNVPLLFSSLFFMNGVSILAYPQQRDAQLIQLSLPVCGNSHNWMGSGIDPKDCGHLLSLYKSHVIDQLDDPHEEYEFLGDDYRVMRPFTLPTPIKQSYGRFLLEDKLIFSSRCPRIVYASNRDAAEILKS